MPAVMTAAVCDTILISLAVAGVSVVILNFEWLRTLLFAAGILFLAYIGWTMWRNSSDAANKQENNPFPAKRQIIFAASVSLLNPHAILDTIGVIGTSSLFYSGMDKWIFTAACILVSWIWFFSLAVAGRKLGQLDAQGKRLNG